MAEDNDRAAPRDAALRCPTCYATAGERCRTKDGRPTSHHTGHPRVARCESWGCGAKLGEPCRTNDGRPAKRPHARNAEAIGRSGAAAWALLESVDAMRRARARFRVLAAPSAAPLDALAELGLGLDATAADVARVFRRRAMGTHPDHGGDAEDFKRLVRVRDAALAALEGA